MNIHGPLLVRPTRIHLYLHISEIMSIIIMKIMNNMLNEHHMLFIMIKINVLRHFGQKSGCAITKKVCFLKKFRENFFLKKMQKQANARHKRPKNVIFYIKLLCHRV